MTLYDKIKEMNIEDMASAIAKIASNCYDCGGCHVGDGGCLTCIEVQLKETATEELKPCPFFGLPDLQC